MPDGSLAVSKLQHWPPNCFPRLQQEEHKVKGKLTQTDAELKTNRKRCKEKQRFV